MKFFRTDLRGFFLTNGSWEPQVIEYAALQTVKSYVMTFSAYLAVAKEWMYWSEGITLKQSIVAQLLQQCT